MAEKLIQYYKYVKDEAGLDGQMKLAITTKIPSTKAALEPDSPDNIAAFKKAIQDITGKPAPSF